MDRRRLSIALGLAIVISLAVTTVFYIKVRRQQLAMRPAMKKVVAAASNLEPGVLVSASDLTTVEWPESVPLEGAITNPQDVTGRALLQAVNKSEPIRMRDVAAPGAGIGLTAKIPDGMRATAVKTNEVNNIAGFLFPGCRVDVLATFRLPDNASATKTVLQNVQVISAGTKIEPDPQGKPENVGVITLLTTPEDSQKLALAGSQGTIQFVLRNGADKGTEQPQPISFTELAGIAPKVTEKAVHKAVPHKTASVYTVETVAGDKTSLAKF